jgi:hypothetical protein
MTPMPHLKHPHAPCHSRLARGRLARGRLAFALQFGVLYAQAGCAPAPNPAADCTETELVVGVLAQTQLVSALGAYRVSVRDERGPLGATLWDYSSVRPPFPVELPIRVRPSAAITVEVLGSALPGLRPGRDLPQGEVILRKTAVLEAAGCGGKRLMRVRLDTSCAPLDRPAPVCTQAQTCESGRCVDARIARASLEPYRAGWPQDEPDTCNIPGHGEPQIALGSGQSDYLELNAGDTLQAEAGPQGGHHIWIAVRMRQLAQSGTTIALSAIQPASGIVAPKVSVVFSFEPDEGGFCKVYGLRYQLDAEGKSIDTFLGKPLDLQIELRDPSGRSARATKRIQVASSLAQVGTGDAGVKP